MRGEPVVAEAVVTLQQHEVAVSSPREVVPGSRDPGGGCTGSWECVVNDLCLHTGFLVAAVAALLFHARLWCPS